MVRINVRFPENLYAELKRFAEENGVSIAEIICFAALQFVQNRSLQTSAADWKLPGPFALGQFTTSVTEWRTLANER